MESMRELESLGQGFVLRLVHCPTWERRSRGQERTINQPLTAGSSWSFCFLWANTDMGHGIKGLGDGEGLKWKRPKLAHYTLSHFSQWWSLLNEYCSEPPFLLFQPFFSTSFSQSTKQPPPHPQPTPLAPILPSSAHPQGNPPSPPCAANLLIQTSLFPLSSFSYPRSERYRNLQCNLVILAIFFFLAMNEKSIRVQKSSSSDIRCRPKPLLHFSIPKW